MEIEANLSQSWSWSWGWAWQNPYQWTFKLQSPIVIYLLTKENKNLLFSVKLLLIASFSQKTSSITDQMSSSVKGHISSPFVFHCRSSPMECNPSYKTVFQKKGVLRQGLSTPHVYSYFQIPMTRMFKNEIPNISFYWYGKVSEMVCKIIPTYRMLWQRCTLKIQKQLWPLIQCCSCSAE